MSTDNRNSFTYRDIEVEPRGIFWGVSRTYGQIADYQSIIIRDAKGNYVREVSCSRWWQVNLPDGTKLVATKDHARAIIDRHIATEAAEEAAKAT